ncbi:hypothetical protein SAMN03097708_01604 [Thiohalomonas denitrificans]|uniref:Uncharacterized protein n=1 Tax=Thiohalomonas denitrificans TaxID=415747 RepID=A0A1G5Q8X1_9GAMM|nr:hypothetical protein SAMN03097708_01604 [Thiohalomonas denitrificans]
MHRERDDGRITMDTDQITVRQTHIVEGLWSRPWEPRSCCGGLELACLDQFTPKPGAYPAP